MIPNLADTVHLRHPDKLFIGGAWVAPSSSGTIDIVSPVTEEVIYTVAEAREADMDRAVAAARATFDDGAWRGLGHAGRAAYLAGFAERLKQRGEELSHAWTAQIGVLQSIAASAALGGAKPFEDCVALAATFPFREEQPSARGRVSIVREPVGVVAAIVPWNGPLFLACSKLAPALLAGCTVILKASPETPLEALILAEIAEEIGLPPGVLNVVVADRDASEHLVRNPDVDKVAFTGSTAAGKKIATILAGRMARYTMELGGKSAAIVLDDYEPEAAVRSLTRSISHMSGQVCAALTRIIVPRDRHDDYAAGFVEAMGKLRVGSPYDPASQLGPLASKRQLERVQSYVEIGVAEGAQLVAGGGRPPELNQGYYFQPTVFAGVDNGMRIAQEEIFGPVLCVIPADDEADAIRIANDSIYGLNGCVFTGDNARAQRIAGEIRSGSVSQNGFRLDPTLAFGGYKQSGVGREGGAEGLHAYLEVKATFLDA